MREMFTTATAFLDKVWVFIMGGCIAFYIIYLALFKDPRETRKKSAALLVRAKAQHEGVEKMCGADKKLRELMEKKGPLSPQDPEVQKIFKEFAEGEKQFRENSGVTKEGS